MDQEGRRERAGREVERGKGTERRSDTLKNRGRERQSATDRGRRNERAARRPGWQCSPQPLQQRQRCAQRAAESGDGQLHAASPWTAVRTRRRRQHRGAQSSLPTLWRGRRETVEETRRRRSVVRQDVSATEGDWGLIAPRLEPFWRTCRKESAHRFVLSHGPQPPF